MIEDTGTKFKGIFRDTRSGCVGTITGSRVSKEIPQDRYESIDQAKLPLFKSMAENVRSPPRGDIRSVLNIEVLLVIFVGKLVSCLMKGVENLPPAVASSATMVTGAPEGSARDGGSPRARLQGAVPGTAGQPGHGSVERCPGHR